MAHGAVTQLFVKIIPLRAGTAEPAGEFRMFTCPPEVEPDTVLSFLIHEMGEVIETLWTSTERHQRISIGWVFHGASGPYQVVDFACVPFLDTADGLQPMFEAQADQREDFGVLGARHGLHYRIVQRLHRSYQPSQPGDGLDQQMADIAGQVGATLHAHPRPGPVVRRVVLEDDLDYRGTRYQDAMLGQNGTLTITDRDQGAGVREFFGSDITCYEWVYTVVPDRVAALTRLLGGHDGDDVLDLLAAYHQRTRGQISDLMRHPDVTADFSNWVS